MKQSLLQNQKRARKSAARPWIILAFLTLALSAWAAPDMAPPVLLDPPAKNAVPGTAAPAAAPAVAAPSAVAPTSPPAAAGAWEVPAPGPMETAIARIVCQMLPRFHYERLPVDDKLFVKVLQNYFDRLDHERYYFLQADYDEFTRMPDLLDGLARSGRTDFAFALYGRLVQRIRERVAFVRECLKQPMDFTVQEEMQLDRSKNPWCRDLAEMNELWRLRVKNQVLTQLLLDEEQKDKDVRKKASGKPESAEVKPPKKSVEERVLQFHERYLTALEDNDVMDILEIFLTTVAQAYDPHSNYFAPSSEEDFDITMKLSLQGIGAVLTTEDGYVKILEIVPGGPADLNGRLHEGDRIVGVAQEKQESVDVVNMPLNKVVRQIRGAKGTRVVLTVLSAEKGGINSPPVTIEIVRDEVKLTEQEAKCEYRDLPAGALGDATGLPPGRIAVIQLPSFYSDFEGRRAGDKDYKSATRDVERLLKAAKKEGVSGVILDLRTNGGGSLEEAVSITGLFVPTGPVVQVCDANRKIKIHENKDDASVYDGPLVVLVNRLSASASEIVAAALQDYHRAVVVGDQSTHGKGTVQTVYHLDNVLRRSTVFQGRKPGSLKFTVQKFYRINGGSTQRKGVVPDIVFPAFTDFMELGESELPNSLPWDEIDSLSPAPVEDVSPFLDTIKENSRVRTMQDQEFVTFEGTVKRYGEIRQMKKVSLNRVKRESMQKEEEALSKKIQATTSTPRRRKAKPQDDEDVPPPKDFVLEEAVRITGDLGRLEHKLGEPKPVVAAKPEVRTPQPVAAPTGN